ncbi:PREDICTED: hypoxia up-regulated protein 1-like isoform X1 [Branchiostoma belcheri]|uniref:Hypoxia up-regulated protein 1 n=1 Tax=Branchiostoma belcheri TaxID=7741 RepID=A0A6P4YNI0_BRABE|nr:PREDICTED: hypoxia up-regulated protein 1-like isoform X1 [Branchiostoma belcheri]XP_019623230.1 PREDICTED: hypoxia up-regulated protein 1-like isoform X1 [Branchiostoma belcheri]
MAGRVPGQTCCHVGLCGAVLLLALFVVQSGGVAVMSVDLGSEWMKVAIVKPGVPMEIALNKESKRKTPVVVSIRNGEREFENDALTVAVKYPKQAYRYIHHVLGQKYDSPQVARFQQQFPHHELVKDEERGTVLFKHDEETLFSPEEVLGMVLNRSREIAEHFAEEPIRHIVITVPAYFNQAERRAVMRAAELVDLTVLQLMNDNSAVALHYGVFRRKEFNATMQHIMFYDMGATGTTATIVGYQVVKTKEKGITDTHPQLVIKGVGHDRYLGGLEMELRLRDHLADVFSKEKKASVDIRKSPRAMAKMLKEAKRVKKVLSANSDHQAQIEGVHEDIDFRTKVTRVELEEMCADLFDRVAGPVRMALKSADMTMGEIDQVIIFGGGTRVPKVQEALLKAVKKSELGKSVNADEAAAMGAVYQAAYLSKAYRVKKFVIKDAALYPIEVDFSRPIKNEDGSEGVKVVRRTLFNRMNPFPQKKVMTFNKHTTDFEFHVNYGDLSFLPEEEIKTFPSMNLTTIKLAGVGAALEKHAEEPNTEFKGVKAHFRMDESGILNLDKVESVFEKQEEGAEGSEDAEESTLAKLGSTISNFFTGGSEQKEDGEVGTGEETDGQEAPEGTPDQTPEKEAEEKPEEKPEESPPGEDKTGDKEEKQQEPSTEEEQKTEKTQDSSDSDSEQPSEESPLDSSKEEEKKETQPKNATEEGEAAKNATKKEPEKKVAKASTVKEDIGVTTTVLDLNDPSTASLEASVEKLKVLMERDLARALKAKALNTLESYIVDMQDKLYQEEYEACAVEEERDQIRARLSEMSDWLYEDESESATPAVFKEKLQELKKLCKPVNDRVKENRNRPKALAGLKDTLNHSTVFLKTLQNISEDAFTQVEKDTLATLINDTKAWKSSMVKQQKGKACHEEAVFTSKEVEEKDKDLQREVAYLLNKLKNYRPPVKKPEKSANKTASNETASGNKTKDENLKAENDTVTSEDTVKDKAGDADPTNEPVETQEAAPDTDKDESSNEGEGDGPGSDSEDGDGTEGGDTEGGGTQDGETDGGDRQGDESEELQLEAAPTESKEEKQSEDPHSRQETNDEL